MSWAARSAVASVLATLVAACGGSSGAGNTTTTQGTGSTAPPPPTDRCPLLVRCYQHVNEVERCPDPVLSFRPNSTELTEDSKTTLSALATEIKQLGRLKKLLIEGHHAPEEAQSLAESRALSVQTRLVDNGVHDELLEIHTERVRAGANQVTFHVIDCSAEQATKRDKGKSKAYWIILY